MFLCPNCKISLKTVKVPNRVFWWCEKCKGRSATFGLLRQDVPNEIVQRLWQSTREGNFSHNRACPSCRKLMAEVPMRIGKGLQVLDVCSACQFIWFDYGEYSVLQKAQIVPLEGANSSKKPTQNIESLKANLKKATTTPKPQPSGENKIQETKIKLDKFQKSQQYYEKTQKPLPPPPPQKVIAPVPSKKIILKDTLNKAGNQQPKKLEPVSKKGSLSPEGITRPEKSNNYQTSVSEHQKKYKTPQSNWEFTPGVLGLPIEEKAVVSGKASWMTWVITIVICIYSLFTFSEIEKNINNIGLSQENIGKNGISVIFKAFLTQSNFFLLLINMYFFVIFGSFTEELLGKLHFLILLIAATLFGDLLHFIAAPPSSTFIGASGGISGVMAYYVWKFPRSKIGYLFYLIPLPRWGEASAYAYFMVWLLIMFFGFTGLMPILSHLSFLSILGGLTVGVTYWFITRESS